MSELNLPNIEGIVQSQDNEDHGDFSPEAVKIIQLLGFKSPQSFPHHLPTYLAAKILKDLLVPKQRVTFSKSLIETIDPNIDGLSLETLAHFYNELRNLDQLRKSKKRPVLKCLKLKQCDWQSKSYVYIDKCIVRSYELTWFFAELLGMNGIKELLTIDLTRISDTTAVDMELVYRSFGSEFVPQNFLRYRCKYGTDNGKSIFSYQIPEYIMCSKIWDEIDGDIDQAVSVVKDDYDLFFIRRLQRSLLMASSNCIKSERTENTSLTKMYETFDKLIKMLNTKRVWSQKLIQWNNNCHVVSWEDLSCVIVYSEYISWKEIKLFVQEEINLMTDLMSAAKCLLWSLVGFQWKESYNATEQSACYSFVIRCLRNTKFCTELKQIAECLFEQDPHRILSNIIWPTLKTENYSKTEQVLKFPVWEMLVEAVVDTYVQKKQNIAEATIVQLLRGVFMFVRCCDISSVLIKLSSLKKHLHLRLLQEDFSDRRVLHSLKCGTSYDNRDCELSCRYSKADRLCGFSKIINFVGPLEFLKIINENIEVKSVNIFRQIPIEFIKAIDESQRKEVLPMLQKELMKNPLTIEKIVEEDSKSGTCVSYMTQSDWEYLLSISYGLKDMPTSDNNEDKKQTKMRDKWTPLLRAWSFLFGNEKTKELLDENVYGPGKGDFWKCTRKDMRDGELLLVAVELGTINGVKSTAWPGVINYRNFEGYTAKELSNIKWGADNEITKFLQEREDSINVIRKH